MADGWRCRPLGTDDAEIGEIAKLSTFAQFSRMD
jgi:hypothetical protein